MEPAKLGFDEFVDVQVLFDVFRHFFDIAKRGDHLSFKKRLAEFDSGTDVNDAIKSTYFEYDDRTWVATITHNISLFGGADDSRLVYFINVRLPNDGYMYSQRYCRNQGPEPRPGEIAGDGATELIAAIHAQLITEDELDFFGFPGKISSWYSEAQGRAFIRIWNEDMNKCMTINWEYGVPDGLAFYTEEDEKVSRERSATIIGNWKRMLKKQAKREEVIQEHADRHALGSNPPESPAASPGRAKKHRSGTLPE